MKAKNVHDDVFRHHRITARRFNLAKRDLRELRVPDKGLHSGRAAEHRFQIRKWRKNIEIGTHEGEVFDIRQLSRVRPDPNFDLGHLVLERVPPSLHIADIFVEVDDEQRHYSLLERYPIKTDYHSRGSQNPEPQGLPRLPFVQARGRLRTPAFEPVKRRGTASTPCVLRDAPVGRSSA